jgi:hydroxymethylpyrimidine/phosphomethylpyrimidine kinase
MKKALTIAGSDSGGGAGIQADLKTFAAFGVYGTSVITALTAQNTKGVEGIFKIPPSFVEKQIDAVMTDIEPKTWKTGMLVNSEIIDVVCRKAKQYQIKNLIVDPVMIAKGGDWLLFKDAIVCLVKNLIPMSYIITPNCHEAEVLTEIQIQTVFDMKQSAIALHKMGAKNVIIKGGHLPADMEAIDVF